MIPGSIENNAMRARVIKRFWPLAAVVLMVFILVSFFALNDRITGTIHLVNLFLISLGIPLSLRAKRVVLASNILAAVGMLTIVTFLFTGGPTGNGFWWSIVYVVGVFLVTSKKWAVFWLSFYFLFSALAATLSAYGLFTIAYTVPELLHLAFVYIITIAFVYQFNRVRDYYLQLSNRRAGELSKLNRELNVANKELEQLAYVASHDLQEPLQTISNFAGHLEKNYSEKLDEEAITYLHFLTSASAKMKNLIKDLLELSRVGREAKEEEVDCNELLEEVLGEMEQSIEESDARISNATLPVLVGNKLELKQLFQNLVSNAVKFRRPGLKPVLKISVTRNENLYRFCFRDNGIGIEEKHQNRIFVIFQRLHSDDEYSGTGIGLATCRKIVELHHGKIWMESKFGEGSTFYFTFPEKKQTRLHTT